MKTLTTIALASLLTGVTSTATTIHVDIGRDDNTTTGNYNNVTATPTSSLALVDDTGAPSGISLSLSGGSFAGSGADYGGAYPAEVSGVESSALEDSLFIRNQNNGNTATITLSGLSASFTYDFLIYGARGNNGLEAIFDITDLNGSSSQSISTVFNNSTEVVSVMGLAPDASNEIVIAFTSENSTSSGAAFNYLGITANPIPEPASVTLLALGGLGLFRRKRS